MKIWKPAILTSALFIVFTILAVFTACERNICDNVNCFNGGSCNQGLCVCPTGYEDPQCGTLSTARYIGVYVGYEKCDALSAIIDSVFITAGDAGILSVNIKENAVSPKVVTGFVNSTVTLYSVIVTNNDSTYTDSSNYRRIFTVTLQSDKTLSINIFEHSENKTDTFSHTCNFLGNKVTP
jgi:hypothetical protein